MITVDWKKFKSASSSPTPNICTVCHEAKRPHKILKRPAGKTSDTSCWGPGIPTHERYCTGCGFSDGPWVSADLVGCY